MMGPDGHFGLRGTDQAFYAAVIDATVVPARSSLPFLAGRIQNLGSEAFLDESHRHHR
jgi:hypothetical protein